MAATGIPQQDPVVAQRRLRNNLRNLRLRPEAMQTQKQVAKALDWSPSKLLRIEAGQVPIATSDLIALLTHYGIFDRIVVDPLIELARISRRPTLRETYRDVFSREFAEFVQYEAYASVIHQYETKLVPGILQTDSYAKAVIREYLGPGAEEKSVKRRVQARRERSSYLFERPDPPEMSFILDEAAVRRRVGMESEDSALMVEQLERLKGLNTRANVTIQIVPFEFGIYRALRGPFELLEFEDPEDTDLLYLENPQGDELFHEDVELIAPYVDIFSSLEEAVSQNKLTFSEQVDVIINSMRAGL